MEEGLIISVADAKAQLRVEHDEDDQLIRDLIETAQSTIENLIEHPLADYGSVVPAPLRHAARILVTQWYDQRDGLSYSNTRTSNYGIATLLSPYKHYIPKTKQEDEE